MKVHYLGNVVFYVKDFERSLSFYRDIVGFEEIGRIFRGKAAALMSGRTPELCRYHVGIKIGDSMDELRSAKEELQRAGIPISGMSDHTVSQSLYLHDPDGNEVELYVDAPGINWEQNPALVLIPDQAVGVMKSKKNSDSYGPSRLFNRVVTTTLRRESDRYDNHTTARGTFTCLVF